MLFANWTFERIKNQEFKKKTKTNKNILIPFISLFRTEEAFYVITIMKIKIQAKINMRNIESLLKNRVILKMMMCMRRNCAENISINGGIKES